MLPLTAAKGYRTTRTVHIAGIADTVLVASLRRSATVHLGVPAKRLSFALCLMSCTAGCLIFRSGEIA